MASDMYCLSCMTWATGECQRDHELHLSDQIPISHFEEAFLPEMQRLAENVPTGTPVFDENNEPTHIPVFDPSDDPVDMPSFGAFGDSETVLDIDNPGLTLSEPATVMLPDDICNHEPVTSTRPAPDFTRRGCTMSGPRSPVEEVAIQQSRIDFYARQANTAICRLERYCHYVRNSRQITKLWETTFHDICQFVSPLEDDRNTRPEIVDTRNLAECVKGLQEFEITLASKIKAGLTPPGVVDDLLMDERCCQCALQSNFPR